MTTRITAILALLTIGACNTEGDNLDVYDGPSYGTIAGFVYDLDDQPVEGVEVEIAEHGLAALTDADGRYVLDGVVSDDSLIISYSKDGYAKGYTNAAMISWETVAADKRLMEVDGYGSFDADQGGTVEVEEVRVTFGANTVVDDETGELYSGVVTVAVTYVDPYDDREFEAAPGDLQALAFDPSAAKATEPTIPAQLVSYGMTDVTLTGADGQPLNLADGETAAVDMSITNGDLIEIYQVGEGNDLPNWSWDTDSGRWVQEAQGDVYTDVVDYDADGNRIDWSIEYAEGEEPEVAFSADDLRYTFEASHFSWWNCDQGFVPTCAEGRVLDVLGFPVRGARVEARGSVTTSVAYTDEDGYYNVTVMAGDDVTFTGLTHVADRNWTAAQNKFIDGEGSDPSVCEPIEDIDIQVCREAGIIMTDNISAELTTTSGNADRLRAWFWEPPGDVEECVNPWDDVPMDECVTFDPDEFANYQPDMDGYPHDLRSVGDRLQISTPRQSYTMDVEDTNGKPYYRHQNEEITTTETSDMTDPADLDGLVQENAIDFRGGDVLSAVSTGSYDIGSINESNWVTIPQDVQLHSVSGPMSVDAGSSLTLNFDREDDSEGLMVFGANQDREAIMCRFHDDGSLTIPSSALNSLGTGNAGLSVFRPELGWTPGPDGLPIRVQAFSGTSVECEMQ